MKFPNGYTTDNPPPNFHVDEHFQNWMRTAGLPTFTKLYGRNDQNELVQGSYQITVDMSQSLVGIVRVYPLIRILHTLLIDFPVRVYTGTKSIVISTVSWVGGKNPFLGWAYVAASSLFVILAIAGTIRHIMKPRRLGDMSLLSWNQ